MGKKIDEVKIDEVVVEAEEKPASNAKRYSEEIENLIEKAFSAIKKKESFEDLGSALNSLKSRSKFDSSMSAYTTGMVLFFDPDKIKVAVAEIGRNGSTVLIVPKGIVKEGKVLIDGVHQVYLSTLSKTIRVTDAEGDPRLDEVTGAQQVIDGRGNPIWEACSSATDDAAVLQVVLGKLLQVKEVKRGFGPAGFVDKGGTMIPTSHRLTSLPLFEEIQWT